ncbi:SAM-dependent methyltransferase [Rhodococcus sp. 27YEA15]|uniref:methyltransferase domain-containing protein n=1 Tax=Rhodococcus sp. 27YEA15 TaxID=3156259 RepID=UPI003C7C61CF
MSTGNIGSVLVSSRSFDEYVAMFALDDADLESNILDCPAGASAFTADARRRGTRVTACDRAYADGEISGDALRAETIRGNEYVSKNAGHYCDTFFRDAAHHLEHRLHAVSRFVEDSAAHPNSYVAATLPTLPFDDGSFDLVLSSHLLFTYADRLDVHAHDEYLRELVRVAGNEVRVFPLVPMGSSAPYPELDLVRRRLDTAGIDTAVVGVDYEFQRGATEMLVCVGR